MTSTAVAAHATTSICPPWCVVTPEAHARELEDAGGYVHHAADVGVTSDPHSSMTTIGLSLVTDAAGLATQRPVIYLGDPELTIDQAESVIAALQHFVAQASQ